MDWTTQISGAHNRIAAHVVETPTVSVQSFGLAFPVELKLEHLQHAGSFKARGAFNTLLSNPVPEAGLVAASGGNHGAAVAFAARALGHNAKIYVPEIAGQTKIDLIRSTGCGSGGCSRSLCKCAGGRTGLGTADRCHADPRL